MKTLQIGMGWFCEQPGGLNRVYEGLIGHLPDAGVDVSGLVAGSADVGETSLGLVRSFAAADRALPGRLIAARGAVAHALAAEPIDLIASHFALYACPALDRMRGLPLVVHFHGPWAAEGGAEGQAALAQRIKRAVEAAVYRHARLFIVLSDAFGQVLNRRYGVPLDRIRIVPGGLDVARYALGVSKQEARAKLGWPQDRRIVLTVRRLARRMGLDTLIEAAALLRPQMPDLFVAIAGRGKIEAELRKLISERGLDDTVRLTGFMPDESLPYAYRAADISIVPSTALEGFGLTTIESLASGTPVLVTPVGGLPEIVRDLSARLILDGAAPEQLSAGLGAALSGARELPAPEICRSYVESRFSWPIIADKVRAVYEEARA